MWAGVVGQTLPIRSAAVSTAEAGGKRAPPAWPWRALGHPPRLSQPRPLPLLAAGVDMVPPQHPRDRAITPLARGASGPDRPFTFLFHHPEERAQDSFGPIT